MNAIELCEYLQKHQIEFERLEHPAVYTCEEADKYTGDLAGAKLKNLFLRDKNGKRHFLVALDARKSLDLKTLGQVLGVEKLSFASEERLAKYLGVGAGAVTLLAVVNDPQHQVEVIVDAMVWESGAFQCHPLENTSTLVISRAGLRKFFELTGHAVRVVALGAA
jgi:Ala-tRNA(Pro) deacylase